MIDMVGRKEASKGSLRETGPRQQFQVMIRTLQCLKRDTESRDPLINSHKSNVKAEPKSAQAVC